MAESPGLGVVRCLEQLSDAEFLKFKELLRKNPKLQDKLISWTNTETTLRKDLITLLNAHFPGQVWDIMSSMFLQVNRRDLWTKAQELRRDKRSTYKEIMKTTFHHIWFWETFIRIPVKSYQEIVKIQHKALQTVFGPQLRPVTAVILGAEAIGKTTFLRKAMLDWASGDLWQNRFQYVFFFSLISLNSTTELSLAQLLLSQLSASSETLDDVLSDPRKILFILDGFDHLKFDLELRTNLCDDWRKTLPTQIVLSSLLQKVMLPESSLLLELGNPSIPKLYPLLQYPREITMGGLTEESIKFYCVCFFNHVEKGLEVFDYLQSMQALPDLCISPYVCWMFCSTVKGQCDRGEEMNFFCPSDSIMYTKFMVSSFRSVYDKHPSRQNRARLKTLCTLAAEGMWKQVFVFKSEDLRRNGISESEQTSWLRMNFLHYQGDCFMFYHPMLQSYFAALFYYLRQDKDTPQPIIGSLPQFLREVYAHGQTQWLRTGMFVFGIASEEVVAMLNPHFGLIPRREIREVIFNCLRSLSKGEHNKTLSDQSLIDSLIDIQKEKFETQVMDLFEELTVDISDANKMTLVEYSLLKSLKLKKLHMHIHHSIFSEIYNPEDGDIEDFRRHRKIANKYWGSLCGIFWNLQVLDLDSCNFNETAIQHLCESLSPAPHISLNMFKLQSLSCSFMTNFGDGTLLHTVLQLPHLRSLNLYGTNLSNDAVEKMCSGLKSPTCRLEELLLGKCGISSKACGEIAASLIYCKLKHLSLVENPLKNKGAMLLCEILRHPSCILEKLMLSCCSLTFIVCGHLSEALLCNKYLSLLDLGSNVLEDFGANILCEALKDPKCPLQELWLSGCCLTSDCCEQISTVLTCNKNLKTLKLGNNNIQDTGVKRLCEALRNPTCKLQSLGLDMCALTTACCADLALALSTCRTLTRLSLDWVTLAHDGVELLCEALTCRGCNLKVLGLDKSALSEESQKLLQDVEKKNNLNILHYPWVEEENKMRGVRLVWNSKN